MKSLRIRCSSCDCSLRSQVLPTSDGKHLLIRKFLHLPVDVFTVSPAPRRRHGDEGAGCSCGPGCVSGPQASVLIGVVSGDSPARAVPVVEGRPVEHLSTPTTWYARRSSSTVPIRRLFWQAGARSA